jgi:hypothetical protein
LKMQKQLIPMKDPEKKERRAVGIIQWK